MKETISTNNKRPIIFGEVLFDRFPDGTSVLGGAPFNVAWHLQGFGLNPLFISRIGNDDLGKTILDTMDKWGMDSSAIQMDNDKLTGVVDIELSEQGNPVFNITPHRAYDYIDIELTKPIIQEESISIIYHGSLIIREEQSKKSLFGLVKDYNKPVFLDVNLRPPWWNRFCVENSLNYSKWVKMNENELSVVAHKNISSVEEMEEVAKILCREYEIEAIIVTRGSDGAFIATSQKIIKGKKIILNFIKDTVGAGDAFSSVVILGLFKEWSFTDIIHRALEFAGAICQIRGATTLDTSLYQSFLEKW